MSRPARAASQLLMSGALAAGCLLTAAPSTAAPLPTAPLHAQSAAATSEASYFFVVVGREVRVSSRADSAWRVRIELPHRSISWFTDRPVRESGSIRLDQWPANWRKGGFHEVPPNGWLVLRTGSRTWSAGVTVTGPRTHERAISFVLTALEPGVRLPRQASSASLFIDPEIGMSDD